MLEKLTNTPGGKVAIAVVAVLSVAIAIFAITKLTPEEGSRTVTPEQAVSDAQKQIDAINKMTNLSQAEKDALIAHERGNMATAKGAQGGANPGDRRGTQPPTH